MGRPYTILTFSQVLHSSIPPSIYLFLHPSIPPSLTPFVFSLLSGCLPAILQILADMKPGSCSMSSLLRTAASVGLRNMHALRVRLFIE